MRNVRFVSPGMTSVVAMFAALAFGCSSTGKTDEVGTSADAIRALQPGEIVGKIANGETKNVAYTSTPRFRAFSFFANRGDEVDVWARSTTGDAMLWLAAADNTNVAVNDDAAPGTVDAHIVQKLTNAGQYFVVLRDYNEQAAQFTVTFAKRGECDPDEQDCDLPPPPPPEAAIVIPEAVAEVSSSVYSLLTGRVAPRLAAAVRPVACPLPLANLSRSVATPYVYVRVENPSATDKRISLWTSKPEAVEDTSTAFVFDTVLSVYPGTHVPETDAERLACAPGTWASDMCVSSIPTACLDDLAGLVADDSGSVSTDAVDRSVVVPANGAITVYVSTYFPRSNDGSVQLNVRTEP